MKTKLIEWLSVLTITGLIILSLPLSAFALEWNGSSTGGGGSGSPAGPNGYAIRTTGDNCIGYRFSVVDKSGNTKGGTVIDVFRNTTYGNMEYSSAYKFTVKYNKKQLINNQNNSFSTSKNTSNCYKEADMGFTSSLPTPDGMNSWQSNHNNLNRVLSVLGIGSVSNLKNGDKVLVEPLYDVRLQSVYHSVTVTELAIYGKYILGVNSNGGSSSTSESWGFISSYTNRHYPNSLYTTDGQGLWTGASAIGSSSRSTFYDIINKGYGVGIAYTETKPDFSPALNAKACEVWKGSKSTRSFHYGTSDGSAFGNYSYANGYPIINDTVWYAINFPAESENCYVRQTVWVDGGGSTSRNVWSNSNTWYDVALSPITVDSSRSSYTVKARADWIDSSGNVLKWGTEKTFYIPIRPKINRFQVSLYNIAGGHSAYNGSGGSGGVVYAGQRVYPYYTFTSSNTWSSYNTLTGNLYAWSNGSWQKAYGASDMTATGVGISHSSSYGKYSSLYPYRVPDNSANTNGSNRIPFELTSAWYSDTGHTSESTWIDIPIVKADVELTQIRLIGDSGYYLDQQNLEAGQNVTVQYTYRNNTSCTVYVNGYNNDRTQISGIYAIPAYSTINVNGYSFEVPNQRSLSVWGGVYLEGLGIYHTSYETNGTNNSLTLTCNVNHPLRLTPITPNAAYREATSVITSYWLTNGYRDHYTPASNITVRFRVYRSNGTVITTMTKTQAVVLGNDMNLIYFKWNVPTGLNYGNVTIMADVLQDGVYYNLVSRSYFTIPYFYYETPDTQFESNAPSGFSIPTLPSNQTRYATWWEYTYSGRSFVRNYYGIGVYADGTNTITPATGATAAQNGSTWTMKSGYGISLQAYNAMSAISGYIVPSSDTYTSAQYGYALFPEYNYASASGKYQTLDRIGSYWYFPTNRSYGKVHFIPLWYPDGNYTVKVIKSDCWTPAGMITATSNTNTINISGSAYDDWYVGR